MKVIALTALAAAAGLATANPISAGQFAGNTVDTAGTPTATMVIDISGIMSNDAPGSALNEVLNVFLGVGGQVTGLSWDVTLSTIGGSWASEATIGFGGQINLNPGSADSFTVSMQNYSSGGILDLTDLGLNNIVEDGTGNLAIEFSESFVDNAGTGDAIYEAGSTVTIYGNFVPTPGSLAVLGLGGLVAGRRRR